MYIFYLVILSLFVMLIDFYFVMLSFNFVEHDYLQHQQNIRSPLTNLCSQPTLSDFQEKLLLRIFHTVPMGPGTCWEEQGVTTVDSELVIAAFLALCEVQHH